MCISRSTGYPTDLVFPHPNRSARDQIVERSLHLTVISNIYYIFYVITRPLIIVNYSIFCNHNI